MSYNSTIVSKPKKCKGIGKAKGFDGCGILSNNRKYGLCNKCLVRWIKETESGQQYLKNRIIPKAKRKVQKEEKEAKSIQRKKQWKANKDSFYSSSAWKWFSRFVKLYHANIDGTVKCVTSGQVFNLHNAEDRKNLVAGHFIKVFDSNSSNYSTAFVLDNCYPQSRQENTYLNGNEIKMQEHIIKLHGEDKIDELKALSKKPFKLDKWVMDELSDKWRNLYKDLVKQKGFDPFKN